MHSFTIGLLWLYILHAYTTVYAGLTTDENSSTGIPTIHNPNITEVSGTRVLHSNSNWNSSNDITTLTDPDGDLYVTTMGNAMLMKLQTDQLKGIYDELLYAQDMYVIPFVCPIGIIGNGIVANNLFTKRNANSSFIYMAFILLADILSLVSDLFLPLARLLQQNGSKTVYETAIYIYFWNADILSFLFRRFSLNVFCVLSFERLIAIKKPLKLHLSTTATHSSLFITLALLVSIFATIVTPLFTKMVPLYENALNTTIYTHAVTDFYLDNAEYFDKLMIIVRFLDGPVQIMFFTVINGMIVHVLYKNKLSMALSNNQDRTKNISKLQSRLCKIFLILSFTNMLAFLPNSVIIIVAKLFPETGLNIKSYTMKLIVFGGNILRVLNSLTDFAVFLIMSKEIRNEFKKKLICWKKKITFKELYLSNMNMTEHTEN
ncbi:HTR2 [Mytilus edulis]|uniref:HTR2 n=1 Tax=Mytilus edulis TaxID=6550 RepID=A0A8S3VMG4_MYTED|nr:HTR2 [Mytilus edulis]